MKNDIVEQILMDVCSSPRVSDGIVNFEIQEHVDALIEVLKSKKVSTDVIRGLTNSLNEGRFPERQAYNKEGFLVTFPTPEYKKKAMDSGGYSDRDPTKGQGGMHLLKKVEPVSNVEQKPDPAPIKPIQKPSTSEPTIQKTSKPAEQSFTAAPQSPQPTKTTAGATQYTTGVPVSPTTDLKLDKISAYKDPSLEWVHNRKWSKRENNNYYDAEGNLKAITGLDGVVIPVSEEERMGLKKFIDDKEKEKLGITPTEEPPEEV